MSHARWTKPAVVSPAPSRNRRAALTIRSIRPDAGPQPSVIVSHRHRFIFFAVPRTGTHAVRAALAPLLGEDDWQQQSLTARSRLPVAALARLEHGHISLRQAQAWLPEPMWRGYFKFAFVRNPYDRFVSVGAMLHKRNAGYAGNEAGFLKRALGVPRFRQRVLVRPQADLLTDATGDVGMDFTGRYETLQASFAEACRRIGLPERALQCANAAAHRPFTACYDDELLQAVTDFYRADFELFGYPVGALPPCA